MTNDSLISRRKILAAVGAVGLVATGPRVVGALRGDPPYTRYTYAQIAEGQPNLKIAWYETYNGTFQEAAPSDLAPTNESFESSADEFVDDDAPDYVEHGPVVSLGNVMPGDAGTLIVGLVLEDQSGHVWFRPHAPDPYTLPDGTEVPNFEENGVYEPETAAGDPDEATDPKGELQNVVELTVWYDSGFLDAGEFLGGCNGSLDAGESLVGGDAGDVDGVLIDLHATFEDGVQLFPGSSPLETGDVRCIGIEWRIPDATDNLIQTDSVRFDLEFAATVPVGDESPRSPWLETGGSA